ncbi:MAG: family 10 glycosylhydrolase [Pirellulales bacterium]
MEWNRLSSHRPVSPRSSLALASQFLVVLITAGLVLLSPSWLGSASVWADEPVDVRLQLAWGGGSAARIWQGSISLSEGAISEVVSLGFDADQSRSTVWRDQQIDIRQTRPRRYDGAVVRVQAPRGASLRLQLAPDGDPAAMKSFEVPLVQLLERDFSEPLDDQRNSILINRRSGDSLRIEFHRDSLVFAPGERWTFDVVPNELKVPDATVKATLKMVAQSTGKSIWTQEHVLRADPNGRLSALTGQTLTMPAEQGVYRLDVSLQRPWTQAPFTSSRPVAERSVQMVVVRSSPDLTQAGGGSGAEVVAEFDPAHPSWWERLPKLSTPAGMRRWLPGNRETRLTSDGVTGRELAGRRWVDLPPGGWQAFPLPLEHSGQPHEVVIEYPATEPQSLAFSWLDPNAAGELAPGNLDTGVVVERPLTSAEGMPAERLIGTHRMLVWPRAEGSILLVVNRSVDRPACFGTIRVRRLGQPLTSASATAPPRQLMAYLDSPTLHTTFSGAEQIDPANGRTYEDWGTFQQAGEHLLEYLRYIGYQGTAILAAGDGSTLYPSEVWRPTPRFDRGVFFSSGQDPVRKDVLEYLMRAADRDNLTVVPLIRFNGTLAALELQLQDVANSTGIQLVDLAGKPAVPGSQPVAGVGPHYNPLDPRVQQAMVAAIEELVGRYAHHRSFGGVVVDLSDNGYSQLPNWDWGADRVTWQRFVAAQEPGVVPAELEPAQALREPNVRRAWLNWRVGELNRLYTTMHNTLQVRRPDIRLYLAPNGVLATPPLRAALWPLLEQRSRVSIEAAFQTVGLDLAQLAKLPQCVVLRPRRYSPSQGVAQNAINLQLNALTAVDAYFDKNIAAGLRADLVVHEMVRSAVPSFDRVSPYGEAKTYTVLDTVFSESGAEFRRGFADALDRRDANLIFDGGWTLPMGQQDQLREWLSGYRQLPAGRFEDVTGPNLQLDPIQIRKLTDRQRSYVYLLNSSAWTVTTEVQLKLPYGTAVRGLGTKPLPELEFSQNMARWKVELQPYELIVGLFDTGAVGFEQAQSTVQPDVVPRMREEIALVKAQIDRLQQPEPLTLLANPGFETGAVDQSPSNWQVSAEQGARVVITRDGPADGQQSCLLESNGGRAWMVSEPIASPASGRLYVSVRLKAVDPARQPRLQFGIEGRHEGRPFNRADQLGGDSGKALTDQWREFVFPVEDLPLQGLSQLKITFDLLDPGSVLVDDVRVYDLYLTEAERKYVQLSIVAVANQWISEGKLEQCSRLLDTFWPRMLREYNGPPQPALVDQTPAQPERPNKLRNGSKEGPSFSDALRRVVPRMKR